jgi:hypothetical protein
MSLTLDPIFAQGAWANLIGSKLARGTSLNLDSTLMHSTITHTSDYNPPTEFSVMLNDPYYPLYLDPVATNPLLDLRSPNGLSSWAAAIGLHERDLFAICLEIFLLITASIIVLSLLLWTIHALVEYLTVKRSRLGGNRASSSSSPRASLGGKEAYDRGGSVPNLNSVRPSGPGRLRRTWLRFRPKGEAGAFHAAALYGNLLRLILLFHLPITTFSIYQLTLAQASIVSRVFAALAFTLISILIPVGILYKVYRTPGGKLYDATRTLLSLGPMYNVYKEEKQMFRVFPLAASLIIGVVVGAGQKSGLVQAVILVLAELAMLLLPAIWYPWGEGASMGTPSAFLGIIRVASAVLLMLISPTVSFTLMFLAKASSE